MLKDLSSRSMAESPAFLIEATRENSATISKVDSTTSSAELATELASELSSVQSSIDSTTRSMTCSIEASASELSAKVDSFNDDNIPLLPTFWIDKYKREASKNWNLFYRRGQAFKNRHWIGREFGQYLLSGSRRGLEAGCGMGNLLFPILEENRDLFFYACDFSAKAVDIIKNSDQYDESRCHAFVCDLVKDELSATIAPNSLDAVTLIFVLSAVPLEDQQRVLKNAYSVMKPGSFLCFRDYSWGDFAQKRFAAAQSPSKIAEHTYVRQDGTISHFFTLSRIKELMSNAGFVEKDVAPVQRMLINRKRELSLPREFIQGVWMKPADTI